MTVRVDTTNADVGAVYRLWRTYLRSRPDSVRANPLWSAMEREQYEDFDLTRRWIYDSPGLLRHFRPRVLSIEPRGEAYEIRTLYYAEGLEGPYAASNPWALQTVFAQREGGRWVLAGALPRRTSQWDRKQVGSIRYIYPADHPFDVELAGRAATFTDSLAARFNLETPEVTYYLARSPDELAWIIGLDYTLGPTTGRAYAESGLLLSGIGREHYPHELAHLVFRDFDAHPMLEEGVATYAGGVSGLTPAEAFGALGTFLEVNPEVGLADVVADRFVGGDNTAYYAAGAVLVRMAEERGGPEAVKRLLSLSEGEDAAALFGTVAEVLQMDRAQLAEAWRRKAMEYAEAP